MRNHEVVRQQYNRTGLALALLAALCFFAALWGLNGYFTARSVYSLGVAFDIILLSWGTGWLVHLVVSLIEQHLYKLRGSVKGAPSIVVLSVYALIILVGVIDVFTSAVAFLLLFESLGLSPTDPSVRFVATVLAEVIAILPEPVIVWLAVALYRVLKD